MDILDPNNEVMKSLISDYSSGGITMIYGNAASGKTTCCLLATLEAAKQGKIIYIDTENGFNTDRLSQLNGGDASPILDHVFLLQPKSFEEQSDALEKVKRLCENPRIKLVVLDTAAHHYRGLLNSNHKEINHRMAEQMANLVRIARDLEKIVIVTNQVYSNMEGKGVSMVGGNMMMKLCKTVIELDKQGLARYACLIKNKEDTSSVGKRIKFKIGEKGLFLC